MITEPATKRVVAFIDGQNLFYAAKEAFGHSYPNYDVKALAEVVCQPRRWQLGQTRFYSGIPHRQDHPRWHHFWMAKMRAMIWQGVYVYNRPLHCRHQSVQLRNGTVQTVLVGEEKGIDVRIALDVVRLAYEGGCEVLLLFSQDQDLSEVADEVRRVVTTANERRATRHPPRWPIQPPRLRRLARSLRFGASSGAIRRSST